MGQRAGPGSRLSSELHIWVKTGSRFSTARYISFFPNSSKNSGFVGHEFGACLAASRRRVGGTGFATSPRAAGSLPR